MSTSTQITLSPEKPTITKNFSFHLDFSKIYQYYQEQKIVEGDNKKNFSKSTESNFKNTINNKPNEKAEPIIDLPNKVIIGNSGFHKYKNNIELLKNLKETKNNSIENSQDDNKNRKTSFNSFINKSQKNLNKSSNVVNQSLKKSFYLADQKSIKDIPQGNINFVFNDCNVTIKNNIIHNNPSSIFKSDSSNKISIKLTKFSNISNSYSPIKQHPKAPVDISRNKCPEMPLINDNRKNLKQNNSIYNSSSNLNKPTESPIKRVLSVSPNLILNAKIKSINLFPSTNKNFGSGDKKLFMIKKGN